MSWIIECELGSPRFGDRRGTGTGSVGLQLSPVTWCREVKVQLERSPAPPWIQHKRYKA